MDLDLLPLLLKFGSIFLQHQYPIIGESGWVRPASGRTKSPLQNTACPLMYKLQMSHIRSETQIKTYYCSRRNFRTRKNFILQRSPTSSAIKFRTATVVSHSLLYVHGFRLLLNLVLPAKSTKYTKLNRRRNSAITVAMANSLTASGCWWRVFVTSITTVVFPVALFTCWQALTIAAQEMVWVTPRRRWRRAHRYYRTHTHTHTHTHARTHARTHIFQRPHTLTRNDPDKREFQKVFVFFLPLSLGFHFFFFFLPVYILQGWPDS